MAKRKLYNDVAVRVTAAVLELNAALVEAHEHPQVWAHMIYLDTKAFLAAQAGDAPMQYSCRVTRITKHAVAFETSKPTMLQWRAKIIETPAKKPKKAKKAKKSPARKAA